MIINVVQGVAIAIFLHVCTDIKPFEFRWWVGMLTLNAIAI